MKKAFFFAATFAAMVLTSCNNDDEQVSKTPKYITVSTSIGAMTRVVNNGNTSAFEDGDKISVYAWTGTPDAVNTGALVVNNAINTLSGSKWSAQSMMKWTDMITPHYFLSMYPVRTVTDFTADAVNVDPAKQTESDMLVAVNTGDQKQGLTASNNPVSLKFDHVMSKLIVELAFRNEFDGTPTVTSVSTGAKNAGTINYLTGTVSPTGDFTSFNLPAVGATQQYASVVIPQELQKITVLIDGKSYVYTHPQPLRLSKGKVQTVKLIVGRNRIELDQVTINDWENTQPIEGGEAVD